MESVWQPREYAVCVNMLPVRFAHLRAGDLPCRVEWIRVLPEIPKWLQGHVSAAMPEGVAWKLVPLRVFPARYELSLDNDVILWAAPRAMKEWLASDDTGACLMGEDVASALGQFGEACNYRALNSGIRGLPPGFDMERRLRKVLDERGITLQSELDEQGLQAFVLSQTKLFVVSTDDVSICSPFPNHQQHLGRCGAHFVGINPKRLPWLLDGRPAHDVIREFWLAHAEQLRTRVDGSRNDRGFDLAVAAVS